MDTGSYIGYETDAHSRFICNGTRYPEIYISFLSRKPNLQFKLLALYSRNRYSAQRANNWNVRLKIVQFAREQWETRSKVNFWLSVFAIDAR